MERWYFDLWEASLRASLAPSSIGRYAYHLRRFAAQHPDPAEVTTGDIEARLVLCHTPEYRRAVRTALRSWFAWAGRAGLSDRDPTAGVLPVRVPRRTGRPAPEAVIAAARLHADSDTALMILLGAQAGLRRAEIAAVAREDVDGQWLRVVGKGGHARDVALTSQLQAAIAARPPGWLFPGRRGGHMTPDAVGRRVSRALGPGWAAHSLRHRAATRAYQATLDLIGVQQQLGHASVATTQRYVAAGRERQLAVAEACA